MTDDINDVRHTSTLAKFEEAVRRSSPVSASVLDRIEQRLNISGTGEMGLLDTIHAVAAIIREARTSGHAQTQQQCVPVADLQAVIEIASRNEYAPQISRVKAWLSSLADTSQLGK